MAAGAYGSPLRAVASSILEGRFVDDSSSSTPVPRVRYIIRTRVQSVEEVFETHYHDSNQGSDMATPAKFERSRGASRGWFVHFEGSYEALYFGPQRPLFTEGDPVQITFERLPRKCP